MRAAAGLEDGSLDGLAEYQHEAAKRCVAMVAKAKANIVGYLFHSEPETR